MSHSSEHQVKAWRGLVDLGHLALLNSPAAIFMTSSLESHRPALAKQLAHLLIFELVFDLWVQVSPEIRIQV